MGVEPLVNMLERRVRTDQRKAPDDPDAGGGEYEDGDDAAVVDDAEQAEQGQRPQDVELLLDGQRPGVAVESQRQADRPGPVGDIEQHDRGLLEREGAPLGRQRGEVDDRAHDEQPQQCR